MCNAHYLREWKKRNPDYHRDWQERNKAHERERHRVYRNHHKEARKQGFARWHERAMQDPEYRRRKTQAAVEWARQNRDQFHVIQNRRRARKRDVTATLTAAEWRAILDAQKGHCFYCDEIRPLVQEHKTPLSRGGTHTADNVVGSCAPCNGRKHTKTAEEFMARKRSA